MITVVCARATIQVIFSGSSSSSGGNGGGGVRVIRLKCLCLLTTIATNPCVLLGGCRQVMVLMMMVVMVARCSYCCG